jgi:hypothetical protein
MNPGDFTTVSYKFILFGVDGEPADGVGIELQYLDEETQLWRTFHADHIVDGGLLFEEEINPPGGPPKSIFLQENHIPELRLVAEPYIHSAVLPEVLSFNCELITDEGEGTLLFDFGTSYIVGKGDLVSSLFSGFQIIASPFPALKQEENLIRIEELEADVAAKDAEIATLNAEIVAKDAEIAAKDAEIAAQDAEISSLNAEIVAKDAEIAAKDAEIAALNAELEGLNTTLEAKDLTIASLNAQLLTALSDVQLQTLNVARLENIKTELEETIVANEEQIGILQEQLNIDATPVRVSTLYQQLVDEIGTSAKTNGDAAYKLANISLKLKTVISRDAEGVNAQLFDVSSMDRVNGDAVSELVFDIAPAATPSSSITSLPNLLGLTETAVRRILMSLDLRLNPVFQNNPQVVNGDSFKQTPGAGSTYSPNDTVTVIFSKHE